MCNVYSLVAMIPIEVGGATRLDTISEGTEHSIYQKSLRYRWVLDELTVE